MVEPIKEKTLGCKIPEKPMLQGKTPQGHIPEPERSLVAEITFMEHYIGKILRGFDQPEERQPVALGVGKSFSDR